MSLKVLVLSRNYPNEVLPILGLWVEGLVRYSQKYCDLRVVSPVPYCPPLPEGLGHYSQYRQIPQRETLNGIEVLHPRFLIGPGYSLHSFEAQAYYWGVRHAIDKLRHKFSFDVIHAHCVYPDGVVAARLGQRYGIPVVITEHSLWHPWLDHYPQVRRQVVWAAKTCAAHVLASSGLQDSVERFVGSSKQVRSIPIGVDTSLFTLPSQQGLRNLKQILYVGRVKFSKGVDYLLKAMSQLIQHQPNLKLVLAGGGIWGYQSAEEMQLQQLAQTLGLQNSVEFLGPRSPTEIAALMQESGLVVLPSLRESFGAVLVEALACGTPVVATYCGGPEDIVNNSVGRLVPKENADALAQAISHVLHQHQTYEPLRLRNYAVENYAWERVAAQTVDLYEEISRKPISSKVA